jgi:hypothetical protein
MIGKIIAKQNEYFISQNMIKCRNRECYQYLPNDIVCFEYNINVDSEPECIITELISRSPITTLGVINSKGYLMCPLISDLYKVKTLFSVDTRMLVNITQIMIDCIYVYGSLYDRSIDCLIIKDLYKIDKKPIIPKYMFTETEKEKENSTINKNIIDLTHLQTFNIDPIGSRDFDDAISIEGNKIYVHIVDIHNLIPINNCIDCYALSGAFTLYTNEGNINILPNDCAEDLFSLVVGQKRRVLTTEFDTETGLITGPYPSIIINKERFDYDNFPWDDKITAIVNAFIAKNSIKNMINIGQMAFACTDAGSIASNPICVSSNDRVHKFIETLMIMTNIHISQYTTSIPQRYHRKVSPSSETELSVAESLLYVMKGSKAIYSDRNQGHSGLSLKTYTHFTSPIRRYFDVIIHRMINGVHYENLIPILKYINDREYYIRKLTRLYADWKIDDYILIESKEPIFHSNLKNNIIDNGKYLVVPQYLRIYPIIATEHNRIAIYIKSFDQSIYVNTEQSNSQ